jgi:biopolymer transport protein ExbD
MATLSAGSSSGRKRLPPIDMTPMVDLAFLLLTFFVLTTALTKPLTLQIDMPDKVETAVKQQPIEAERALTLVLDANNKIHWYAGVDISSAKRSDFSPGGIRKIIAEKKKTVEKLFILLKPSDKSLYKNVIDILDEMIIADHKDFSIVDLDPLDKELLIESQVTDLSSP